jgi:predicted CXXCH cytochrome family protein
MTYGGAVYKQRYLFRVGANLFPFVQFNQNGDESFGDRGRKPWRDYHADWLFNEETKKLANPSPGQVLRQGMRKSCHYNGYTLTKTAAGDYKAGSANDRNGELDIDGDGKPNEINMGCETCHGPGSVHDKAKKGFDMPATIVSPNKLAAERSSMICGQCHSRPQGNLKNDQPVNTDNKMMLPGTSRNTFLSHYTTREDAGPKDYWADGLHSKSHHQQYTDFIKSSKHRNGNQLVACSDCHDTHDSKFPHQMKADTNKAESCTSCHKDSTDMGKHVMPRRPSATVDAAKITCSDCHDTKTMQTGAGLGKGMTGKDGKNYWLNDITSHLYDVPRKDQQGRQGRGTGRGDADSLHQALRRSLPRHEESVTVVLYSRKAAGQSGGLFAKNFFIGVES